MIAQSGLKWQVTFFGLLLVVSLSLPRQQMQATAREPSAFDKNPFGGERVNDGEYHAAALAIEKAVGKGPAALRALYDMRAPVDTALEGLTINDADRATYYQLLTQGKIVDEMFRDMVRNFNDLSFELLAVRRSGDTHVAIFRIAGPQQAGIDYQSLNLSKDKKGQILVVDWYDMAMADTYSAVTRRMLLPLAAKENPEKLPAKERLYVDNLQKVKDHIDAMTAGKYEQATAIYNSLPKPLREYKNVLLTQALVANTSGNFDAMDELIRTCQRLHPGEGGYEGMIYQSLFKHKKFAEALAMVDVLDKTVGGDPFLDVLRADVAMAQGKPEQAERLLNKASTDKRANIFCFVRLLDHAVAVKDHDNTVKHLLTLEARFEMPRDDLSDSPKFADFVKSRQYQEWIKGKK